MRSLSGVAVSELTVRNAPPGELRPLPLLEMRCDADGTGMDEGLVPRCTLAGTTGEGRGSARRDCKLPPGPRKTLLPLAPVMPLAPVAPLSPLVSSVTSAAGGRAAD